MGDGPASPLVQSAKKMKEVMEGRGTSYGASQSQRVLQDAAQDSADGDNVFFALRKLVRHANLSDMENMLRT